jgi:Rad3-related DNA helicase
MVSFAVERLEIGKDKPEFEAPDWEELRPHFSCLVPRPYQKEVLTIVAGAFEYGYNYVMLEAPTGFGKSPMAIALAKYMTAGSRRPADGAYIVVSSKYLQDQYIRDFATVTVKGRGNFHCLLKPAFRCSHASCVTSKHSCPKVPRTSKNSGDEDNPLAISSTRGKLYMGKGAEMCHYWKQKCNAMNHAFPILNYDYILNETEHACDFGRRRLAIFDEAHNMEQKLMNFVGFSITSADIRMIDGQFPGGEAPIEEWAEELGRWDVMFSGRADRMDRKSMTPAEADKFMKLMELASRCREASERMLSKPENWVVKRSMGNDAYRQYELAEFSPVRVADWGKKLTGLGEHVLMQSATILDPETLASSLGISGQTLYIKVPSIFAAERRRIHYKEVGRMSYENIAETMPKMMAEVEKIINENPDEKGVIHTHNYRIQKEIMWRIKNSRLISNQFANTTKETFEKFLSSDRPLVLVTPSAYEGVDFKGPACRWQILCKVPYPPINDPQISRRMQMDRKWYDLMTALRLIQTYGRGMRSVDDFCKTYVLDSNFGFFVRKNRAILPDWFKEAIVWENSGVPGG